MLLVVTSALQHKQEFNGVILKVEPSCLEMLENDQHFEVPYHFILLIFFYQRSLVCCFLFSNYFANKPPKHEIITTKDY